MSNETCPPPLRSYDVHLDPAPGAPACSLPCPLPLFTADQWRVADLTLRSCSVVSILSLGCMFTYLCIRPWGGRVTRSQICFAVCVFFQCVSLSLRFGSPGDGTQIAFCNGDAWGGLCMAQAAGMQYFILAAIHWWLCSCIELSLTLDCAYALGHNAFSHLDLGASWLDGDTISSSTVTRMNKWHCLLQSGYVAALLLPAVSVVILLANDKLGWDQNTPTMWCFYANDPHNIWQCLFFWGPGLVLGSLGSGMFLFSVHNLCKSCETKVLWEELKLPFLWCFMWLPGFTWICAASIIHRVQGDVLDLEGYVACIMQQHTTLADAMHSPCTVGQSPTYLYWITGIVCTGGLGGFTAAVLCLSLFSCCSSKRAHTPNCTPKAVVDGNCLLDPYNLRPPDHQYVIRGLSN